MDTFLWILMQVGKIGGAVLLFSLIIFVHELGHFMVAKACRVRVNEFALGMGPKLFSFGKGETRYSLRLVPFGGFCAMEGEDDDSDDPASFSNKPVWQRILVVVAGVAMNFLLAYAVLTVALGFLSPPNDNGDVLYGTTTLLDLKEDATSYKTGLRAGDTIIAINGRPVATPQDMFMFMQSDDDGVLDIKVRRDGKRMTLAGVTFDKIQYTQLGRVKKDSTVLADVILPTLFDEETLSVGDVITHVDEVSVNNAQELTAALKNDEDGTAKLSIVREGESLTVPSVYCSSLLRQWEEKNFNDTTVTEEFSVKTVYIEKRLQSGDVVTHVNSKKVTTVQELVTSLQSDEDGVVDLTVTRNGEKTDITKIAVFTDQAVDLNEYIRYDFVLLGVRPTVFNTIVHAAKTEWSHATTVIWSLVDMVRGKYGLNELAGPVGTMNIIGDMVEQTATNHTRESVYSLLMLFSLICVNVGVMNLLPLPALDGGRLIFLLFELVLRKPVPKKFEGMVHLIGLGALLLFMLLITFNDVFRLMEGWF